MKYSKFVINKFKGIDKIEINLDRLPNSQIFPVVGLNESGKTTILEAINFFENDLRPGKEHEIIHKRDKGAFNGEIKVQANLILDQVDKDSISEIIKSKGLQQENIVESISITKIYEYKNGGFEKKKPTRWNFTPELKVKTSRQQAYRSLYISHNDVWKSIVDDLEKTKPKILYFPDFIFKTPERIFLEETPNPSYSGEDKEKQKEYRDIFQDVLSTCNPEYKLADLIRKLKSGAEQDQDSAQQIIIEAQNELNKRIIDPWNDIFPNTPHKTIEIKHGFDAESVYVQIRISEGNTRFYVDERSLGFRWFFGFILFTEFRKARLEEDGEYLFLFDEPANNLNQSSQQKLLLLLEKIADKAKIIYATHSHHLLSTKSILSTLVVKDEGRETENNYDYRQNIKATPYQQFFAQNPTQVSHFKLILDVLEYTQHPFELTDKIVFFEGKNDYCTFKWIYGVFFEKADYDLNFYPGSGVNRYENIFREYLAHNRKFIAIFDDDGEEIKNGNGGKAAKLMYIDNISPELKENIFTLGNIDRVFSGFETEDLFTPDERLEIQKVLFPESDTYEKTKFNMGVQQLFIEAKSFTLSTETIDNFKKVFDFIQVKFIKK